jgi:L-threonylcarbamoyladenylate synthase
MAEIGTDINKAIALLNNGELIGMPTETVYGLAANALDPKAVLKIYEVKNRPSFNPLIIHSNSIERFTEWGIRIPENVQLLATEFSPGPLTYLLPKGTMVPEIITAGHPNVAIRIPNHPMALDLLSKLDYPLAAPSANPSEYVSPTNANHVNDQLGDKIKYILDGGPCTIGLESTIIDMTTEPPTILRLGAISKEQIEQKLNSTVQDINLHKNTIVAPGMMKRHYATKHALVFEQDLKSSMDIRNAVALRFSEYADYLDESKQFILSVNEDLNEAAANLFSVLRQIDQLEISIIIAEEFPNEGIGRAINDRLRRASIY